MFCYIISGNSMVMQSCENEKINTINNFIDKPKNFHIQYSIFYFLTLCAFISIVIIFLHPCIQSLQYLYKSILSVFIKQNFVGNKNISNSMNNHTEEHIPISDNNPVIVNKSLNNSKIDDNITNDQLSNVKKTVIIFWLISSSCLLIYGLITFIIMLLEQLNTHKIKNDLKYLSLYINIPKSSPIIQKVDNEKWNAICDLLKVNHSTTFETIRDTISICYNSYRYYRNICSTFELDYKSQDTYNYLLFNLQNSDILCKQLSLKKLNAEAILTMIYKNHHNN